MVDVNTCVFSGRLVRDVEQKTLPTGTKLITFDMANNTGWGQYAKTLYITVNLWGKSGEGVYPYLKKGKSVAVTGSLSMQEWTSQKDGTLHQKLVVSSNSVVLLGGGGGDNNNTPKIPTNYGEPLELDQTPVMDPDDIPF